jgi:VWFA-related protein
MNNKLIVSAPILALIVMAGPAVTMAARSRQSGSQAPVFRTQISVVSVDVAVRDKSRRAMTDLKAADFAVQDNGVRQTVDEVSYAKRPIDVTVGLDVSGSVTGQVLDRLRRGVLQLMQDLREVDRLKLVVFNTQVHRTIDFTSDAKAVDAAMRGVPAGGATALLDTLSVELVAAREPERRQLIVFFTDGADSGSITSRAALQTVAERSRGTVAFVISNPFQMMMSQSLGGTVTFMPIGGGGLGRGASDSVYSTLARETGGYVLSVDSTTNLGPVFRKILDDFRSSYVLFFSPTGVERAGFHTITVDVQRPGAVVQARRGYFGG